MPVYLYAGRNIAGKQVSGDLKADSKDAAIKQLRIKKIRVMSVKEKAVKKSLSLGGGVKIEELSRFTRQFGAMTSAGLPLVQCMDILAEQNETPALRDALKEVSASIQGGNTLADSLRKHKKVFNDLYCNMIAAGEASGNLDGILGRLAEYQEKSAKLQRKIKGAMTYPIVLATIAAGATGILLTFVVPQFAKMFTDMGGELPLPTRLVMGVSDFLQTYLLLIIAVGIGSGALIKKYYATEKGAFNIDTILLKAPVLGDLLRKTSVSRFAQTLSTLLISGVSILQALEITAKTSGNKVIEKGLLGSVDKISGGQTISEPLAETKLFPPMVIHMIAVGEKTGDISTMLVKVAVFYEEEVDAAVEALTSIMEPIMIVVMGAVIGSILIAMYMPMFDMVNL